MACDLYFSTVPFDDRTGQTQPQAFVLVSLGGEKGVKDVVHHIFMDADSVFLHINVDYPRLFIGRQVDFPFSFKRLRSVGDEVHKGMV